MIYGILDLPWWGYIVAALIMTHITIVSVTVYLHRCQAHRALDIHPAVSHFFRLWLWLSTGMVTKAWAAIHRKHHAKCETPDDPHSPQVLGLMQVMWEGAELYRREALNQETLDRYGHGTPDDWIENNVYTPYSAKGIFLMMAINLLLFGIPGLTIWAVQMAWIPFFAAGIINGVGHFWGYRNFECEDAASNIVPWGILIGGEELHNNHHTYPTSAKLSVKWWEFDIGWFYIRTLMFFGLAKVKRVPPQPHIVDGKNEIDAEGLQALLSNRIQVMTTYTKKVLVPLLRLEKQRILPADKALWRRIKSAMTRGDAKIDANAKESIDLFLQKNRALEMVYNFREQLKGIWNRTTATQKELIDALHEWCVAAEASGNLKLKEFVQYIKGYTIRKHA